MCVVGFCYVFFVVDSVGLCLVLVLGCENVYFENEIKKTKNKYKRILRVDLFPAGNC